MPTIKSIQVLRAIAACAVVLFHAAGRAQISWPDSDALLTETTTRVGQAGVDLFFVLSGFLMAYLHFDQFGKGGASQAFLLKRLARIVPIYWLLSGAALVLAILMPSLFSSGRHLELGWLLGNFAFIPWPDSSGSAERLVVVGWTLDYEMMFYALFALAMLSRHGLLFLCWLLFGAAIAGQVFHPTHPWAAVVTSLMLLEFLAGIAIAALVRRYTPPRWVGWLLIAIGSIAILSTIGWEAKRTLQWGIPAAILVLGTVWAQIQCKGVVGRYLVTVGDASYSIYLTQVFSLPAFAMILKIGGVTMPSELAVIALWVAACGAGVVFWWMIERPLTALFRKRRSKELLPKRFGIADVA